MLPAGVPQYRVQTKPSLVEHWRHLVEIVALLTAAVWAFYVFVYQEPIKPATDPPRLQMSTNASREALQGGKEPVTIMAHIPDSSAAATFFPAVNMRYELTDS